MVGPVWSSFVFPQFSKVRDVSTFPNINACINERETNKIWKWFASLSSGCLTTFYSVLALRVSHSLLASEFREFQKHISLICITPRVPNTVADRSISHVTTWDALFDMSWLFPKKPVVGIKDKRVCSSSQISLQTPSSTPARADVLPNHNFWPTLKGKAQYHHKDKRTCSTKWGIRILMGGQTRLF